MSWRAIDSIFEDDASRFDPQDRSGEVVVTDEDRRGLGSDGPTQLVERRTMHLSAEERVELHRRLDQGERSSTVCRALGITDATVAYHRACVCRCSTWNARGGIEG